MERHEQNKMIAEFMGFKVPNKKMRGGFEVKVPKEYLSLVRHPSDKLGTDSMRIAWGMWNDNLEFDSSWEWIMPVVRKINELNLTKALPNTEISIIKKGLCLRESIHYYLTTSDIIREDKKEEVYIWSCNFIAWYNEQKEK